MAVAEAVHHADDVARHDRQPARHGLQDGVGEALGVGRAHEHVAGVVARRRLGVAGDAEDVHGVPEPQLRHARPDGVDVGPDARDRQPDAAPAPAQDLDGAEQVHHALAAVHAAVVEERRRLAQRPRRPAGARREPLDVDGAGHDREAVERRAQPLVDGAREAGAPDEDRAGVAQDRQHRLAMRPAALADPVAVAALDRDHVGHARPPADLERRQARRVAVLGVDDVERLVRVPRDHGLDEGLDVGLEVAGRLLPHRLQPDDLDAVDGHRRAVAVDRRRVAAVVLAHQRHVVARRRELADQVERVDAHARDGREEPAGDEADAQSGDQGLGARGWGRGQRGARPRVPPPPGGERRWTRGWRRGRAGSRG